MGGGCGEGSGWGSDKEKAEGSGDEKKGTVWELLGFISGAGVWSSVSLFVI